MMMLYPTEGCAFEKRGVCCMQQAPFRCEFYTAYDASILECSGGEYAVVDQHLRGETEPFETAIFKEMQRVPLRCPYCHTGMTFKTQEASEEAPREEPLPQQVSFGQKSSSLFEASLKNSARHPRGLFGGDDLW